MHVAVMLSNQLHIDIQKLSERFYYVNGSLFIERLMQKTVFLAKSQLNFY